MVLKGSIDHFWEFLAFKFAMETLFKKLTFLKLSFLFETNQEGRLLN